MGIYIPSIETPKGHNYVTITIWPSGTASYGLFNREENLCDFKSIKAVNVPPHGRLGDLDELEKSFREDADAEWNRFAVPLNWADALADVADIVADAPTIIPAEEG